MGKWTVSHTIEKNVGGKENRSLYNRLYGLEFFGVGILCLGPLSLVVGHPIEY